jgi:hypothetical protein
MPLVEGHYNQWKEKTEVEANQKAKDNNKMLKQVHQKS